MFRPWRSFGSGLLLLGTVLTGAVLAAEAQRAQAVAALDLTRFTGSWYEIARLPYKPEKKCVGDVLTLYGLDDKATSFSVVNTCSLSDGTPLVRNDSGKRAKHTTDGRLATSYFVFLHRQTWVLALDPNYQWALVGSPNHKTLWLYSRTLTMDPALLADLRGRATAQGFDVAKLVMTPQTNPMRRRNEVVTPAGGVVRGVAP